MHKERTYNLPAKTRLGFPEYGEVVVGVGGLDVTIGQSGNQKYWARVEGECYTPDGKPIGIRSKGFATNSSFESMLRGLSKLKR
ncbi:MAG: hypothetical protein HYT72_00050 [Candidatus Aenigmarchaeota archaeon]|nr:hypothetical protein [Candidatus Aenigmarchaeota archaeon]